MSWYWLIVAFLLGVAVAFLATYIRNDGKLRIYIPDYEDEPPYPVAEFKAPLQMMIKRKQIKLQVEVVNLNLDSQK